MIERDPLEYSNEELNSLSTEELEKIAKRCDDLQSLHNTSQLVQKVLINSLN